MQQNSTIEKRETIFRAVVSNNFNFFGKTKRWLFYYYVILKYSIRRWTQNDSILS